MKLSSIYMGLGAILPFCGTASAADPKPTRIITFFTRNPALSSEAFHEHWKNTHGPLVVPWALQYGVNNYNQYHTPKEDRDALKAALKLPDDWVLNFDGAADFTVTDLPSFLAAHADKYYKEVIEPDEQYLFQHKSNAMVIDGAFGWTSDVVVGGKAAVNPSAGCQKWKSIHGTTAKGC